MKIQKQHVERGFDTMAETDVKKQTTDKQEKHQGVLAYTRKRNKSQEKEYFYDDALNKAFYEMYVLA